MAFTTSKQGLPVSTFRVKPKTLAFLDPMGSEVPFDSRCVNDVVFATKEESRSRGIFGMGYFFIPQTIGTPIEMTLKEVGDPEFGADKVFHEEFNTSRARPVNEVVAEIW